MHIQTIFKIMELQAAESLIKQNNGRCSKHAFSWTCKPKPTKGIHSPINLHCFGIHTKNSSHKAITWLFKTFMILLHSPKLFLQIFFSVSKVLELIIMSGLGFYCGQGEGSSQNKRASSSSTPFSLQSISVPPPILPAPQFGMVEDLPLEE